MFPYVNECQSPHTITKSTNDCTKQYSIIMLTLYTQKVLCISFEEAGSIRRCCLVYLTRYNICSESSVYGSIISGTPMLTISVYSMRKHIYSACIVGCFTFVYMHIFHHVSSVYLIEFVYRKCKYTQKVFNSAKGIRIYSSTISKWRRWSTCHEPISYPSCPSQTISNH